MPDFTQYTREDFLADESFTNYLLHKNEEDYKFWRTWIKDNAQCSEEVKEAGLMFFLIRDQKKLYGQPERTVEVDQQYAIFQNSLNKSDLAEAELITFLAGEKPANKPLLSNLMWKVAAAAAFFLIVFSIWKYTNPGGQPTFQIIAKTDSLVKEVTLPDGSQVQLNANSSLEISKGYNGGKREVLLYGSAFFKVHKDHSKPFIVTTGSIKTTALGTSFYIYNFRASSIAVSLLEGSVRVAGDRNYVELLPGEKAFYEAGGRIFKENFNKTQLLSFTNGEIKFQHASLPEIKTILKEYFNKDVLIYGNAPRLNFTGTFDARRIETILKALQFTYNIKYKSAGQTLIISF